ncbi:MAG: toll/interleukin-1 receptor domain-containing protein [Desulfobacterales bacterium]|nr:toll/interleukin-1 receptor domain-containing protein [Desulfobacterales bacterium]
MGKVFISYSHKDRKWKDRVVKHFGVLEKEKKLAVWDDRKITGGGDWLTEIELSIKTCDVALLLISADFLNSGFILGKEVPKLLERRLKEGIRIIPVIIWDCPWTKVAWLSGIQARPTDGKPLSSFSKPKAESALAALAEEVLSLSAALSPLSLAEQIIQPDQLGRKDIVHGLEQAILLKAEAEFRIVMRELNDLPISKEQITKIEENIKGSYGPFKALYASADIKIDYYLLPLIKKLIQIESELRATYRVPFTQERIASLRNNIHNIVKEKWSYIVNPAYNDAIRHVVHNVGYLYEYKENELSNERNKLLNSNPEELFVFIDELLQKALADSILLAI